MRFLLRITAFSLFSLFFIRSRRCFLRVQVGAPERTKVSNSGAVITHPAPVRSHAEPRTARSRSERCTLRPCVCAAGFLRGTRSIGPPEPWWECSQCLPTAVWWSDCPSCGCGQSPGPRRWCSCRFGTCCRISFRLFSLLPMCYCCRRRSPGKKRT